MEFWEWAPWILSVITGLVGWFVRAWYDDQKINNLKSTLKTKDQDIFHLHEAHELLLKDKEKKLTEFQVQSEIQQKSIDELKFQLKQSEDSAKTLLSTVVENKKKDKSRKQRMKVTAVAKKVSDSTPFSSMPDKPSKSVKDNSEKKKWRKKVYKKKIKKQSKLISKLQSRHDKLSNRFEKLKGKKEVIKIQPVTIIKTIRIKESIDRSKFYDLLEKVPIIKSKKKVKTKKQVGKLKVVKNQ